MLNFPKMDLIPFLKKKKEKKDFLLALLLKPFKVSSILFEETAGKLLILSSKEENLSSMINSIPEEELVDSLDASVSYVENNLPEGTSVKKTIFGVAYEWVEGNKIKKEYLLKLKKICDELELTPIGFIVYIEAVVHFLQEKEGAPISAIFVEAIDDRVIIYLVRAGNIIEVREKNIDKSISKATEEALKEIEKLDVLPSKIVLLNQKDSKDIQHEFLTHQWTDDLPFLHFPQVITLEKGFEDEAVINGVGSQMGFDVLEEGKKLNASENIDKEIISEEKLDKYETFGFLKEKDILEKDNSQTEDQSEKESNGDEVKEEKIDDKEENSHFDSSLQNNNHFSSSKHNVSKSTKKFSSILSGILGKIKKPNFGPLKIFLGGKIILTLIALVIISIISIFFYYNMLLKADISLFLNRNVINKSINVTLSTSGDTKIADSIIRIKTLDIEESGDFKKVTSGKKEIGDQAKGQLTIYNKIEQGKTFSKGTIVVGPNNLKFQLSDDATIASTSAFSTTLSSTKVNITAATFGSEYNLPSNSNFSFSDFPTSSYFAKNETAFSGGTKKEISIVSKDDLDNLLKSVEDNLKEKASTDIKSKIGSDSTIIPFFINNEISKKTYDKKEGDQANDVKINATIKFTGAYYNKKDIENFAQEYAKKDVPANFYLDTTNSSTDIKDLKINKDKTISAKLSINLIYLPKLDQSKLIKDIKGKQKIYTEDKIKEIKEVSDFRIIFRNSLPLFPELLPFSEKNIIVNTRIND